MNVSSVDKLFLQWNTSVIHTQLKKSWGCFYWQCSLKDFVFSLTSNSFDPANVTIFVSVTQPHIFGIWYFICGCVLFLRCARLSWKVSLKKEEAFSCVTNLCQFKERVFFACWWPFLIWFCSKEFVEWSRMLFLACQLLILKTDLHFHLNCVFHFFSWQCNQLATLYSYSKQISCKICSSNSNLEVIAFGPIDYDRKCILC